MGFVIGALADPGEQGSGISMATLAWRVLPIAVATFQLTSMAYRKQLLVQRSKAKPTAPNAAKRASKVGRASKSKPSRRAAPTLLEYLYESRTPFGLSK